MPLISKYVEVSLGARNIKYYSDLGYKILKHIDNQGRTSIKIGTKITIKTKDLSKGSHVKVKVKCDICRKEYDIIYKDYLRYVDDNGIITCKECIKEDTRVKQSLLRKGKFLRENNPNWNPDLTDEERKLDRNLIDGYYTFINKVLARDKYTCQCCGSKLDVVVHHLDGYNWCKEKRINDTNGITLCNNCHKNFHSIYGKGNNTKKQFEEWFGKAVEFIKYDGKLLTKRKVYCIEENKVYNSVIEFQHSKNLKSKANIYKVLNHVQHKNTSSGKHILWIDEAVEKGYII